MSKENDTSKQVEEEAKEDLELEDKDAAKIGGGAMAETTKPTFMSILNDTGSLPANVKD